MTANGPILSSGPPARGAAVKTLLVAAPWLILRLPARGLRHGCALLARIWLARPGHRRPRATPLGGDDHRLRDVGVSRQELSEAADRLFWRL